MTMATRPRRSATKQKDSSIDMLGLTRQEERNLQRAMYDSLRQQSLRAASAAGGPRFADKFTAMATRSRCHRPPKTDQLSIAVPHDSSTSTVGDEEGRSPAEIYNHHSHLPEKQQLPVKRGTRYSPMRRKNLRDVLKSLEDRKTTMSPAVVVATAITAAVMRRGPGRLAKDIGPSAMTALRKSSRVVTKRNYAEEDGTATVLTASPPAATTGISRKRCKNVDKVPTRIGARPTQLHNGKETVRTPRNASVVARSFWLSQRSESSSPSRPSKPPNPPNSPPAPVSKKPRVIKVNGKVTGEHRRRLIYGHRQVLSQSQRVSRAIVATAAQRYKKACIRKETKKRVTRTVRMAGAQRQQRQQQQDSIPPELWLDPRGRPVNTEDFISFLLYRDTPYLDSSLKWFELPPHRRKQRLYKIVSIDDGICFHETRVFFERKDGGGRETIIQCNPPKLVDSGSELVTSSSSSDSGNQQVCQCNDLCRFEDNVTVGVGDKAAKCSASVISSSCLTQAAVEDDRVSVLARKDAVVKDKQLSMPSNKPQRIYESRSTHIMETRRRRKP